MKPLTRLFLALVVATTSVLVPFPGFGQAKPDFTLLNVSFDPTREFYQKYNILFSKHFLAQTGKTVEIKQSHGGSGKQARSVVEGLDADVVTLALGYDIDAIADANLTGKDWQKRLPQNSAPFTSTIVFVVKKGNPKGIKTWEDLARAGVSVIVANPKTSGGARWAFLAAYGSVWKKTKDEAKAKSYVQSLFRNVPVLDSGARGATLSFAQKGLGDVLVTWESEGAQLIREFGANQYEVVAPPTSIICEPPVAVVDRVVDRKKSRPAAEEYVRYLYSPEAQNLMADFGYRPRDAEVAQRVSSRFAKVTLFSLQEVFGDWRSAQEKFFADDGIFDQIYARP